MTDTDYIDLLLNGYVNHRNYLGEFYYRECKAAEKKHISPIEFFERLLNANKYFLDEIKHKYYERLNEVAMIEDIWRSEGKDVAELADQKPSLYNYSVTLIHIMGGKYLGHFFKADYDNVQEAISVALEKTRADVVTPIPTKAEAPDLKKQFYESFNLLRFFSLPDHPDEGFTWVDEEGNVTHDPTKLARKEKIEIPRERIAKNKVDFQLIFERELKKESLENNNETKLHFAPLLIEQIQNYIVQHKKGGTVDSWDKPLLVLAEKFITWLRASAPTQKATLTEQLSFPDLFVNSSQYEFIMNILVTKGYCEESTFTWKDEAKGRKSLLASIIKYLHTQQYYKNNTALPPSRIRTIAKETFHLDIGIDTIKKAKVNQFNLSFIPLCSSGMN